MQLHVSTELQIGWELAEVDAAGNIFLAGYTDSQRHSSQKRPLAVVFNVVQVPRRTKSPYLRKSLFQDFEIRTFPLFKGSK